MINLSHLVLHHARATPERAALIYAGDAVSWRDLADRVLRMAAFLERCGIGHGDVVALFMKNSAAFLELVLAASHRGAVLLPINYRLAAEEAAFVLSDAGARLLFVDAELADALAPLEGEAVPAIVPVDTTAQRDGRALSGHDGPTPDALPVAITDPMRLMYTSGTTSRPKGVLHTYESFYWKHLGFVGPLGLSAATCLLVVGPLYHVGGLELPGLSVLALGGTLCIQRDFDAESAVASIAEHGLTGAWLAPVMTNAILALSGLDRHDTRSLLWAIGGGERTPESRIRRFAEAFPGARYIDAYGLTETNSGDTMMAPGFELERIGSVGRAVPHVTIEIRDDSGERLPPGQEGEICLKGPKITKGYWRDPDATRAAFFGDWFRSGDVGRLDADGFLWLTDRKKDLIISGGENIASSEVERVLYEMPEVLEAAVIGLPDERWGERPVAVVVPRPGRAVDQRAVEAFCRPRLAGFKVPRQLVIAASLPRNPSGKVLKRVLRERLASGS